MGHLNTFENLQVFREAPGSSGLAPNQALPQPIVAHLWKREGSFPLRLGLAFACFSFNQTNDTNRLTKGRSMMDEGSENSLLSYS